MKRPDLVFVSSKSQESAPPVPLRPVPTFANILSMNELGNVIYPSSYSQIFEILKCFHSKLLLLKRNLSDFS